MPVEQIRPLIFHPSDQGRRLIPQLHEVAAWISATDLEMLKVVAASNPEALLGAAAASFSDDQRQLIVDSLLQQACQGRNLHLRWGLLGLYRKLKNAGLADQLRPYLRGAHEPLIARHVAIDIARSCQVEEVGSDLAEIALDFSADPSLRNSAAASAANLRSEEVRARLRPLAFGEAGEDPEDELKGSGLKALWPELISASELFQLLTPRKQPNLSGAYSNFLYGHLVENLPPWDLPVALEWFSKQGHRQHLLGPFDRVMDGIVQQAWDNLHEAGVASGLAKAVVSRVRLHDSLLSNDEGREFAKKVQQNHERRRILLEQLLPQLSASGVNAALFSLNASIVTSQDVEWLIDRVLNGETKESAPFEAGLVRFAFDPSDHKAVAKLWSACQTNAILKAECGGYFEPIALDSEAAKILREQLKEEREWKTPKLLTPPPSERVENELQKVEAGQTARWVQLILELTLEPTSKQYALELVPNLTDTPGWKVADSGSRGRILDAAVNYLKEGDPQNDEWFRTTEGQIDTQHREANSPCCPAKTRWQNTAGNGLTTLLRFTSPLPRHEATLQSLRT
jgi:hypothetical protein